MNNWYLLHTKPYKEEFLWSAMQARNIDCFYPRLHVQPKNPRSKTIRPYFPGYLFVKIEPVSQLANELRWFPGVLNWVYFGNEPASVPDFIVNDIRKHVDGLNSTRMVSHNNVEKGTSIRVVDGAFAGYEGIFESHLSGSERVTVLLRLVHSQPKRVEMPFDLLRIENQYQPSISN
jgi:transcription elongation factor/antiterminator RfaH